MVLFKRSKSITHPINVWTLISSENIQNKFIDRWVSVSVFFSSWTFSNRLVSEPVLIKCGTRKFGRLTIEIFSFVDGWIILRYSDIQKHIRRHQAYILSPTYGKVSMVGDIHKSRSPFPMTFRPILHLVIIFSIFFFWLGILIPWRWDKTSVLVLKQQYLWIFFISV